jgi:two-component system KDP operon response regulator KdpE
MRTDRVLVVDDDPQLQRLLRAQLTAREFVVQVTGRGEDAILMAAELEPELILLSISLPGITGVETCRRQREWTLVPIIALDGKNQAELAVEALDTGADDYLPKPFVMVELLARMRAVLRRVCSGATPPSPAIPLTFDNLTLDLINRRVLLNGQPLHLTPTEYELLRVLAGHAGQLLTHREILTHVWGPESATDTQYLHVFVSQLRRKLERGADAPRHIITEPGVGYQFSAGQ